MEKKNDSQRKNDFQKKGHFERTDNVSHSDSRFGNNRNSRFGQGYAKKTAASAVGVNSDGSADTVAEGDTETSIVFGRNSVLELLKTDRTIDKLFVHGGDREGSITKIVGECIARKIPVVEVEKSKLDLMTDNGNHQGVVAMAAMKEYVSIDDILAIAAERGEKPLIVIADEIEDPHNLGAIIRCAEGSGAHGIIIPKRRSAGLTATVSKASAGALEHLAVCKTVNIASAIDGLKEKGVWIYGAEADGTAFYDAKFDSPTAIVVGSEGYGISRLVREKCDFILSIPMYGQVNSFNVSCASAVLLCEAARQLKKV